MWLAKKTEKGTKYILGQHSSSHITGKHTLFEPGFDSCDKFLAWGKKGNKKCIPFFNTRNIPIDKNLTKNGDKIYFYAPRMYPRRKSFFDDYGEMIRDNIKFQKILEGLNKNIQNNIVIKPYQSDFKNKSFEKKILNEIVFKNKKYKIDKPDIKKQSIYEKSKIVVHLTDGTGILETLSANIPSVFIMSNLNLIRDEIRKDYKSLIKAKILFLDYKNLTNHINNYYSRIEDWWDDKEVVKIKNKFCENYCVPPPKNYMSRLKNFFKEN